MIRTVDWRSVDRIIQPNFGMEVKGRSHLVEEGADGTDANGSPEVDKSTARGDGDKTNKDTVVEVIKVVSELRMVVVHNSTYHEASKCRCSCSKSRVDSHSSHKSCISIEDDNWTTVETVPPKPKNPHSKSHHVLIICRKFVHLPFSFLLVEPWNVENRLLCIPPLLSDTNWFRYLTNHVPTKADAPPFFFWVKKKGRGKERRNQWGGQLHYPQSPSLQHGRERLKLGQRWRANHWWTSPSEKLQGKPKQWGR